MASDASFPERRRLLTRSLCVGACLALLSSCATSPRSRLYPEGAPAGSLTVAQVTIRYTRDLILSFPQTSRVLLTSGIDESEIRDGSVALGRVNCCGGPTEEGTAIAFYIPETVGTEVGDIVEVKLGRAPEKEGERGEVNRVTRVVQKGSEQVGPCWWDPPKPYLWGRVLYCDWMRDQGWVAEGAGGPLYNTWIKRP